MVKREHLRLKRELWGIASSAVPGLSQRAEPSPVDGLLVRGRGIGCATSDRGLCHTGDRRIADAILACKLAKIEGDAVQRALELAGVQFIDADDSRKAR